MSSNLTQRINALQQQMATQHAELLAQMVQTNANLVAVLARMPPIDPNGNVWLNDFIVPFMRLVNAISPFNEELPTQERSSIVWEIHQIANAVSQRTGNPAFRNLQSIANLQFDTFANSSYFNARLGIPDGTPNNNIIDLLEGVYNAARLSVPPQELLPGDIPFGTTTSTGINEDNGRTWVRWTTLPVGVTTSSTMEVPPNTEIVTDEGTTWSGWEIYIYSEASVASLTPNAQGEVLTNRWLSLGENRYPIAISVAGSRSVVAYLRRPQIQPEYILNSFTVAVTPGFDWPQRQHVVMPPPFQRSQIWDPGDAANSTMEPFGVIAGNLAGWRFEMVSGSGLRIVYLDATPGGKTLQEGAALPFTRKVTIDNLFNGQPFTVRAIAPQ